MNRLVLGNSILDWTGDKLLDLLRCGARPRAKGHRDPNRNVGVLPLRHAVVAKPTPYEDTHEQHPRDLWVLHKEPGGIVGLLDSNLVVFVCHGSLLKESLGWGRHLSKAEHLRRPLARQVGLLQRQLNCLGSSPAEPCASWQRACRRDLARPSPQSDRVPKGAARWR